MRLGLIAGNGRFPFLVLDAARAQGHRVTVVAVKEEAFPELADAAAREPKADLHWVSLGQLGTCIKVLKAAGVSRAVMAGQVKHHQIFRLNALPDLKMVKLLARLATKSTDSLLGAVADELAREGITLVDSTTFLEGSLATPGVMTKRSPSRDEMADIEFGLQMAQEIARLDIGQTVAVKDRAVVAVEAMEGTDAVILRAAQFSNGRPLTVVKVSKPRQDMRFDVPVIGPGTIASMVQARATALANDAGRTLLLDRDDLLRAAASAGVAIAGFPPA